MNVRNKFYSRVIVCQQKYFVFKSREAIRVVRVYIFVQAHTIKRLGQ